MILSRSLSGPRIGRILVEHELLETRLAKKCQEEVNEVLIYSSVGPSGPSFLSLGRDGWKHDRHSARGKAFPLYSPP